MKKNQTQNTIIALVFALSLTVLSAFPVAAQTSVNVVCKTGSDSDLPEIKIKIANLAEQLKSIKQAKKNSRTGISELRDEILTIDQELGPWRARHKGAAEQAGISPDTYAAYKAEWIDTGALKRLNDTIILRKDKHQDYKLIRAQYLRENNKFEALGVKYQHIARDLLDRDRDCAAAKAALK